MTRLLATSAVKGFIRRFKELGLPAYYDAKAGTAEAKDGEIVVFKALKMGRSGGWVVRFAHSEQVKWS